MILLNRWYNEGLIHPDFVVDRWFREVASKFKNGRVGYVNYMASYEAFNRHSPGSLYNIMQELQPGCELVPGVPPIGPDGHRGHRVWGAAGGITAFGIDAAKDPQMMIRVLRILDAKVADEEVYVETVLGKHGLHWEWVDPDTKEQGVEWLPPYDSKRVREDLGLTSDSIFIDHAWPYITRKYLAKEMVEWNRTNRNTDWGRPDLFYWSTSVPRAQEFLADLEKLQMVAYADIIRGKRPVSDFDEFVKQWYEQGGQILLDEARKNYKQAVEFRNELDQLVNASGEARAEEAAE